jgi:hypothetical protein
MTWLEILYVTPKLEMGSVRCGQINLEVTRQGVESGGATVLDVREVTLS